MKLTIELVPSTAFYKNLRHHLSKKDWDKLRKQTYIEANYKCSICRGKGPKHPVECHETWHYDDYLHIQKLIDLKALCPKCHQVKHAGFAELNGKLDEVVSQLIKVNKISKYTAMEQIAYAFEEWSIRSNYKWTTDISLLDRILY